MPPPPLSSSTIVSFSSRRRAASSPPMSCASATSPISSTTGPSPRGGRAEGAGDGPVDAVGAAVAQHARRVGADRPERLDVAHGHRGGDEQRRRLRQQHAELARDGRLAEPAVAEHAEDRLGGQLVAAAPAREPLLLGRYDVACQRVERRGGIDGERVREHRRRVLPGALGVERDLGTPARPASHVRSGLETGRSPTRSTRSGSSEAPKPASRSSAS